MNQVAWHRIGTLMEQGEITALGASLREIDPNLMTPAKENGTTRIWYQGGEPYFDVFVELCQGELEWFQFTLRGKSISWNSQTSRWQTGATNELRTDDITFYSASKLIENDSQADSTFVDLAYSVLKTRAGEEIFDKMLALFEG